MKYVPATVTRFGGRQILKLSAKSPTLLVVGGVVGLGATAIMAAKASRKLDPVLEGHAKARMQVAETVYESKQAGQKALALVYIDTAADLTKLYGPTLIVGTVSTFSVLYGHKILNRRHIATMAAYSGLAEQFHSYRGRVAKTLGAEMEREIYNGAHAEYVEDPNHKGEYKLQTKYDPANIETPEYCRPWFDHLNTNHTPHPQDNYTFLLGVQNHMNNQLETKGHVTLNDVLDQLKMRRVPEGQVAGWLRDAVDRGTGDGYIDFGFMTGTDPITVAFQNHASRDVQLNFNIDRDTILHGIS